MIDPRFVFLAALLSLVGAGGYIRDTLRGVTAPNRVTWGLWGLEGVLAFFNEVQQHVGMAAVMTLVFGLVPLAVLTASFRNSHSVWKIGPFDVVCGALSLLGIAFWALVHEPTVALVSFVVADQLAALPTLRKAWMKPSSESAWVFALGVVNTAITLLTLKQLTTAAALFPGAIMVTDFIIAAFVAGRLGPRLRGEDDLRVSTSLR